MCEEKLKTPLWSTKGPWTVIWSVQVRMNRAAKRAVTALRAVRVLRDVVEKKQKLETAWLNESARAKLRENEKRLLRDICSGTCRRLDMYSRLVDYYAPTRMADDLTMRLLAASTLYQSEHMERAPALPALRTAAADCCDALERPWAANMMKELCRTVAQLTERERQQALSASSALSLPAWLHTRLKREGALNRFNASLLLERPDFLGLCVASKTHYGSRLKYLKLLRDEGLRASASTFAPLGVVVHSRPRNVGGLPGIRQRTVHVQDCTQQYGIGLLRTLGPGERLLDACAGSFGGKARCFAKHQPHTPIVAVEHGQRKAATLGSSPPTLTGSRSSGVPFSVVCADAAVPSGWWDGRPFHAIIVDPPCTATGLLRTLPEVKAHRTEDDLTLLCREQLRLLSGLWPLLAEGGELLYLTCSILKDENDGVIREFLRTAADARPARLEPPMGATCASRPHGGIVFYPSETHQGGFVALLRKANGVAEPTAGAYM
jgi:16S rRNA (cytosine967-C5)-methyltransferase